RASARLRAAQSAIDGVPAAGGLVEAGTCQAGAGGPSLEWDAAVLAALAAIDGIPGLRLALSGTLASLEGSVGAGFGQPEFETTLARLAARLPAGFALDARLSPGDARHLGGETIADLGWVMIERRDDALRLAGRIASAEVAAALETIATGLIGRPGIDATDLRVSDGVGGVPPDPTIGQAALVAMDALATTQLSGRALIGPGRVVVTATLADGRDAARLHRGLAAALAPGIALSTRLSVDVPAAVEALPMPADACAAALNREVLPRPIGFAPGSVALDGVARGTVGRLAQVLRRCEDAHIEVGGHTDNQGRSSMNRRLSRARAEAVRAALQQDGQDPRRVRLSARGYGEDEPVADNRTEEGRALNRRIAFRAVIADPALSAGVAPLPGAAPARAPAPASE
ncbi:MAG: OmpA family protein, partial [Pseudomonadota bacterium]